MVALLSSLEIFQKADIHALPVSPQQVLEKFDIPVLTYGQYSQATGKSLPYLLKHFGSDGMTFPIDERLTVFYNELSSPGRIRWTLAHELAHIFLHYQDKCHFTQQHLYSQKDPLEIQADQLAKEILGPLVVLHFCGASTVVEIRTLTGLSQEAASYRLQELQNFRKQKSVLNSREDIRLFLQFEPFITRYISKKVSSNQ